MISRGRQQKRLARKWGTAATTYCNCRSRSGRHGSSLVPALGGIVGLTAEKKRQKVHNRNVRSAVPSWSNEKRDVNVVFSALKLVALRGGTEAGQKTRAQAGHSGDNSGTVKTDWGVNSRLQHSGNMRKTKNKKPANCMN